MLLTDICKSFIRLAKWTISFLKTVVRGTFSLQKRNTGFDSV